MNLSDVSDKLIETIVGCELPPDINTWLVMQELAKEIKLYRGLAEMRKDMLSKDVDLVLGGYSKEELTDFKEGDVVIATFTDGSKKEFELGPNMGVANGEV